MDELLPGRNYVCSNGHEFYVVKDVEKLCGVERTKTVPLCPYMLKMGSEDKPNGTVCKGTVSIVETTKRKSKVS